METNPQLRSCGFFCIFQIKMKQVYLIILCFTFSFSTMAQDPFSNSRFLEDGQESPAATLEDIEWLAGHWHGEAFGGITEEIWSKPLGGSMMGSFKLIVDGQVSFYEFMTITQENKSLLLRIKHFDWELIGWEENDDNKGAKLVDIQKNHVFFDGLSIKKINDDEIKIYVVIEREGKKNEVEFPYKRVSKL